ncbi:MAG: DUF3870 domain-containing protein [Mesorhizobium sp.]|nr:DUF3870 domain-containing protein [Mesorhizobium sp.]MBN9241284.1 DUF3870 domain-containing protein [Mesorhizobium sp.]
MNENRTVLVSGYAQAPRGTGMSQTLTWLGVVLEIDLKTHAIVAADATFVTELARDFFRRTVTGYCLTDGLEGLLALIDNHLHTPSKNSLQTATQAAFQRYVEARQAGKG